MVQACDEVQLSCGQGEAGFLQLNGDGHLTGASVHWKMWDLVESVNKQEEEVPFPSL